MQSGQCGKGTGQAVVEMPLLRPLLPEFAVCKDNLEGSIRSQKPIPWASTLTPLAYACVGEFEAQERVKARRLRRDFTWGQAAVSQAWLGGEKRATPSTEPPTQLLGSCWEERRQGTASTCPEGSGEEKRGKQQNDQKWAWVGHGDMGQWGR